MTFASERGALWAYITKGRSYQPDSAARSGPLTFALSKLLGVESDYGTIEEGKRADLVALDDEYKVRMTIVGGHVLFDAEHDGADKL